MSNLDRKGILASPGGHQARLTALFLLMAVSLVGATLLYWLMVLEPRLYADAKNSAGALAQAYSRNITAVLKGSDAGVDRLKLEAVFDDILIITDRSTNQPFFLGITLSLDPDTFGVFLDTPHITRGQTGCSTCFYTEVPVYHATSGELAGIAGFYASTAFFEQLRATVRANLFTGAAVLLILLLFIWIAVHRLLQHMRDNEQTLRTVFEAAPLPLLLSDRNSGLVHQANRRALEIIGRAGEDDIPRLSMEHYLSKDQWCRIVEHSATSESPQPIEVLFDGVADDPWMLMSAVKMCYHGEEAILSGLADITQRKRAEELLQLNHQRIKAVLGGLDAQVYVADMQSHQLLFTNFASLERNEDSPPVSKCWQLFNPHSTEPCAFCTNDRLIKEDGSAAPVHHWERQSADGRWYACSDRAIPWIDGRLVRLEMATDITALKDTQHELVLARDKAEAATRAKSEFLATMSHEIRTPMNGVLGMVRLLEKTALTEQQNDYLETIMVSGEALLVILNDILDLSRIEAGKLALEPVDFDLNTLLAHLLQLMSTRAQDKGIALKLDVEGLVPLRLNGDQARIRQVLLNLLGNAIKFTEQGEVVLAIGCSSCEGGDRVRLRFSVTDTGIGIAPQALETLFDSFTQSDNSITRRYGGSGLGLSICRRLVEAMGGKLTVSSREWEGSEFSFELELAVAGTAAPDSNTTEQPQSSLPTVRPLTILVVDDDPINRRVVSGLLTSEQPPHRVVCVESGAEALQRLGEEAFDVVLMDLHMPDMDGLEATRRIRQLADPQRATTPVIALTANIMREDEARCYAAGMNGVVVKPFKPERLYSALARAITDD